MVSEEVKSPEVVRPTEKVVQACVLASQGKFTEANGIVQWLIGADRIAAEAGVREAAKAWRRRKKLDEARDRAAMKLPEPPVSEAIKSRIKLAQREVDKAGALRIGLGRKIAPKVRNTIREHEARARRLLREAEAMARSEDEAAWLDAALSESEDLALARGEHVEDQEFKTAEFVTDETGARTFTDEGLPVVRFARGTRKVISNRGRGLEDARDKGYLAGHGKDRTDELYRAGERYRDAWEIVEGALTSRGEGGGGFGPKGPQVRIAEAGQDLATMRKPLAVKQRKVLDAVCGLGLGLDQAATYCGMGAPAVRTALRCGLAAASEALKDAARQRSESPGASTIGDNLKAAAEAVERAGRGL